MNFIIVIAVLILVVWAYTMSVLLILVTRHRDKRRHFDRLTRKNYVFDLIISLQQEDDDEEEWDYQRGLSDREREWIEKRQKELDKQDFINSLPEAEIVEETKNTVIYGYLEEFPSYH